MTVSSTANGDARRAASALLWEGIILMVLGIFAILVPGIFTPAVTTLIGVVLLVGGAFRLWRCFGGHQDGSRIWHIVGSVLAIAAGLILLVNPVEGVLTLTVVLIALFLAEGASKLVAAFSGSVPDGHAWMTASGLLDIVLGALLWSGLPGTAVWAIGLMVSISLLFTGWTAVMFSSALKRQAAR